MNKPAISKEKKEAALKLYAEARKLRVEEQIATSTERAAAVLHEVLDADDTPPIVRVTAAKDILDRGGFKPVDRLAVMQVQPITGMKFVLDENEV